jgi:hypothetical protein
MMVWLSNRTPTLPPERRSWGKRVAHTNRDAAETRNEVTPPYRYHERVLAALSGHGLAPGPGTPPHQLRDAVRDLYRYEIRRLRLSLLAGHIARRDYADHVVALRRKYPLLSLPLEQWLAGEPEPGAAGGDPA